MVLPIDLAELAEALGVDHSGELISLIGGGGKTTSLFALGDQLASRGTLVLTTTTKMGAAQSGGFPVLIDPNDDMLRDQLASTGRSLVWKAIDDRRATGVEPATCADWFTTLADYVIVEADGSRKRPFKAPAAHEPVVPEQTTLLIACIGTSAFGRPIAESCHRPHLVAALAECAVDDELTPQRAAAVLLSPSGSQKGKPNHARFVVALHRLEASDQAIADQLEAALDGRAELIAIRERSA